MSTQLTLDETIEEPYLLLFTEVGAFRLEPDPNEAFLVMSPIGEDGGTLGYMEWIRYNPDDTQFSPEFHELAQAAKQRLEFFQEQMDRFETGDEALQPFVVDCIKVELANRQKLNETNPKLN